MKNGVEKTLLPQYSVALVRKKHDQQNSKKLPSPGLQLAAKQSSFALPVSNITFYHQRLFSLSISTWRF